MYYTKDNELVGRFTIFSVYILTVSMATGEAWRSLQHLPLALALRHQFPALTTRVSLLEGEMLTETEVAQNEKSSEDGPEIRWARL